VALRDVSLEIGRGEIFVVVGLSGSGKTTLLRSLNGLVTPTSGSVRILGTDIAQGGAPLRQIRSRVGMIFQSFGLLPHRNVLSNVAFGLELRAVPRREREQRAREAISIVGLDERADHYPDELSGGQQQRVGLARALTLDPDVLLMDEPFSALDVLIRDDLRKQLLDIQARLKKTIILITHDLTDAVVLANRIGVLHEGRLRQVGTVAEVCFQPRDEVVQRYVTHVPQLEVLRVKHALVRDSVPERAPALDAGAPIAHAMKLLSDPGVTALRVTAANGETVGGVTTESVVRALGRGPTLSETEVGS
jgi:glycine betaine/proline transport system ATP-binding protein